MEILELEENIPGGEIDMANSGPMKTSHCVCGL